MGGKKIFYFTLEAWLLLKKIDMTCQIQILDKVVCFSLRTDTLRKDMYPYIPYYVYTDIDKIVKQTKQPNLNKATCLEVKLNKKT